MGWGRRARHRSWRMPRGDRHRRGPGGDRAAGPTGDGRPRPPRAGAGRAGRCGSRDGRRTAPSGRSGRARAGRWTAPAGRWTARTPGARAPTRSGPPAGTAGVVPPPARRSVVRRTGTAHRRPVRTAVRHRPRRTGTACPPRPTRHARPRPRPWVSGRARSGPPDRSWAPSTALPDRRSTASRGRRSRSTVFGWGRGGDVTRAPGPRTVGAPKPVARPRGAVPPGATGRSARPPRGAARRGNAGRRLPRGTTAAPSHPRPSSGAPGRWARSRAGARRRLRRRTVTDQPARARPDTDRPARPRSERRAGRRPGSDRQGDPPETAAEAVRRTRRATGPGHRCRADPLGPALRGRGGGLVRGVPRRAALRGEHRVPAGGVAQRLRVHRRVRRRPTGLHHGIPAGRVADGGVVRGHHRLPAGRMAEGGGLPPRLAGLLPCGRGPLRRDGEPTVVGITRLPGQAGRRADRHLSRAGGLVAVGVTVEPPAVDPARQFTQLVDTGQRGGQVAVLRRRRGPAVARVGGTPLGTGRFPPGPAVGGTGPAGARRRPCAGRVSQVILLTRPIAVLSRGGGTGLPCFIHRALLGRPR
ncbi:hypothetical protein JD81_00489 [Micromonospora sagamiensis]|uniref:Uncharacterized protein n=1 Tax=Micromonospora sagamiensis TaxID=47875 RepID=A0A562WAL7_9ACTN|nr:hypothetical protein JD81_00489 [Micromonospora sagamiensis]